MKKFANILLFAALLLVGACSDSDKDEPKVNPDDTTHDPSYTSEFPSEETFESDINNNLWEIAEVRYETEDGFEFPSELWGLYAGGHFNPERWYFWDNKVIMSLQSNPYSPGFYWKPTRYNPTTGKLLFIRESEDVEICEILSLKDDILTVKTYFSKFGDPGEMDDDFIEAFDSAKFWKSYSYKDKVINKQIYLIAKYKKVNDPAAIEELKSYFDTED